MSDVVLSARLKAVAELVPGCGTVADIGCDHGKLAVALVQSGRARRAICGDISPGSLEKARKLVAQHRLEGSISLRLGSGLSVLAPDEADTAVLAGMGGLLIARILEEGTDKAPGTLVFSPNRDAALLRGRLAAGGFYIADEALVCERSHFYPVIRAQRGASPALSGTELEFGPVLLQKKPEMLKRFVSQRIRETRELYDKLQSSDSQRKKALLEEISQKLESYTEVERCL